MRRCTTRILIAALTFMLGVAAVYIWVVRRRSPSPPSETYKPLPPDTHRPAAPLTSRHGDLIVKQDGWEVPEVAKLRVSHRRERWRVTDSPIAVHFTLYETGDTLLMPAKQANGMSDPVRQVKIKDLSVYDIGGRRFCYRMMVWDVPLPGESGVGVLSHHTFYDLDGDGKFESWDVEDSLAKPLKMPQWVQK